MLALAKIQPAMDKKSILQAALNDLSKLRIHCESKDYGRPPPLLASLFELLTGQIFEVPPGAEIVFLRQGENTPTPSERLDAVWMRIDTRYGDLASGSGRRIALADRLHDLSQARLAALREGRALLILDWSHEGRPTFWTSNIRKVVAPYGIPPQNIVVLTQNTAPPDAPDDDAPDIHIVNAHSFIPTFWRLLFGAKVRAHEFSEPFGFAAAAPPTRTHHYLCMNYEATAARACLVSQLLERPEKGFVSFQKSEFRSSMPGSATFLAELDSVSVASERGNHHYRVAEFVAHFKNHRIYLPLRTAPRFDKHFMPVDAFRDSALNIVTEKEMARPNQRRFTEKTLKAIIAGIPFVVFGNQGTIALLADTGFDTLAEFVDHSYDREPDPAVRFSRAYEAVDSFLERAPSFTTAEHQRLVAAAAHNRTVFEGPLFNHWALTPVNQIAARHPLAHTAPPSFVDLANTLTSGTFAHH